LAGEEGFEPPNGSSRGYCLTTWRLPNILSKPEHPSITSPCFQRKRDY
jgi:hypothetical protein